jgi:DNA-3-methyladenine glycosylase I
MNESTDAAALCFSRHAAGDPLYARYHDEEWGCPVHGEAALFERICLEGFQVGLSWRTILHKRDAFRDRFHDFEPAAVAAFTDADVDRLANDSAIIRNRAKIRACLRGASAVLAMRQAGETLDALVWGFRPAHHDRPTGANRPDATPESAALAAALYARGFRFVGPVNTYATMQACGLVNDHVIGCAVGDAL